MKTKTHAGTRGSKRCRPATEPGQPTPANVPRQWRWHYRAMLVLRDHLVEDMFLRIAAAVKPLEACATDPADFASDELLRSLTVSLLSGDIHEVDAAMHRICSGTYGICERTGMPIPAERLRAIPWTRHTAEAEAEVRRESGKSGTEGVRAVQGVQLPPATAIEVGKGAGSPRKARAAGNGAIPSKPRSRNAGQNGRHPRGTSSPGAP